MKMMEGWRISWAVFTFLATGNLACADPQTHPFASAEAVKEELWILGPVSEEKLKQIVVELTSDKFDIREKARERLMRTPDSWKPALKELEESTENPEVRNSLEHILNRESSPELTTAAELARSVLIHGHRSLGSELLEALSSVSNRQAAESVIAAARLSVTDDEKDKISASLTSENPLVREGAVRVMTALIADPRDALEGTLADTDGMVRMAVAEIFAAKADPACLDPLADMLKGEDFYLRWKAAGILQVITGKKMMIDPLNPKVEAALDLERWRKPQALKPWQTSKPLPLIPLFKASENLDSWTIARGPLADVPVVNSRNGYIRSSGTGLCIWCSPLRFQNYRVRVDWRFEWEDRASNAGFSLAKFQDPPPEDYNQWTRDGALEVEIKEGRSGALYPSGLKMLVKGKKAPREIHSRHIHNERSADWNTLEIEERDGSLRVWVNGLLQNEATGLSSALTSFGLRTDRTPIDWRNLMLEPLPGAKVADQIKKEKKEENNDGN